MMSTPVIDILETPNPDAYMFRVHEALIPSGTHEFKQGEDLSNSPLAERLLILNTIELILIAPRFITIRKRADVAWTPLAEEAAEILKQFLESGEMAIFEQSSEVNLELLPEIEQRIVTLLNDEIRPAIAQDGGDLIYHGFQDGFVRIELIGACGTCPSSTATLYHGIQNLLKEEIPEVQGVEQL
jgi:Fe-S cluster biogenesis protein NfuA